MITRVSDFKGHLRIPNLEGTAPLEVGNSEELDVVIADNEPRVLIKLLGFDLYKELISNLETDGSVKPAADQKWKDLVDGKDDYLGLHLVLANYIFCQFVENDESHYGGVGVIKEVSKGAKNYSFREKFVKAWRTYFELAVGREVSYTIVERKYGTGIIWGDAEYDTYKPLRVYLDENKLDFPTKVDSFYTIKNTNYYGV